jgi:hypothetical protein
MYEPRSARPIHSLARTDVHVIEEHALMRAPSDQLEVSGKALTRVSCLKPRSTSHKGVRWPGCVKRPITVEQGVRASVEAQG